MSAKTSRQIADPLRIEIGYRAIGSPVARGIAQDDVPNSVDFGEEVDPSRAAIEQTHTRNCRLRLKVSDHVNSDAFVAHQNIADAENENGRVSERRRWTRMRFTYQG